MISKTTFDDAGRGPAIVLLHGYPFDRSMWREHIDFLSAAGYRAIVPDLRGLGETKSSGEIATMDEMARDVGALINELKIDRAVVCGLSMGGYVAFEFVHLFPTRVRALVLAGTRAPADNEQEKQARQKQVELILSEGMMKVAEATLPKLLARRTLAEKPKVVAQVREMILRAPPQGAAAAQRGMAARRDYSDDLARINVPTLVVVGREDTIRPVADAEFIHERIPESHLEIIDDAAHMTNIERSGLFNSLVLSFVERLAR
jgi:pimeloyl-ACP methyl ester carboxylesterase